VEEEFDKLVHFVECFSTMAKLAHNNTVDINNQEGRVENTDVKQLRTAAVKVAKNFPSLYALHTAVHREENREDVGELAGLVMKQMRLRLSVDRDIREITYDDRVTRVWDCLTGDAEVRVRGLGG